MERESKKVLINGKELTLIRKTWDADNQCHWYYTVEKDEPFCDLCDDIKE